MGGDNAGDILGDIVDCGGAVWGMGRQGGRHWGGHAGRHCAGDSVGNVDWVAEKLC